MRERDRYHLADTTSEAMYMLMEAEFQQGERDLDAMMLRLKDLSAYSLTHAEVMDQREGVELLALAKFFGMTTDPSFHKNQERFQSLSDETMEYQGQAEVIKQEIAARKKRKPQQRMDDESGPAQPRLF